MNKPVLNSVEDIARDVVMDVLNDASNQLKTHQCLSHLAGTKSDLNLKDLVSLRHLQRPLIKTCEKFITDTICNKWNLAKVFKFYVRFRGSSADETARYLYYEVVFSQPTLAYPIPQATVSVFFRVEDKHLDPSDVKKVPLMLFRMEGHHTDHDVRHVLLTADWIQAIMIMKIRFFQRVETLNMH